MYFEKDPEVLKIIHEVSSLLNFYDHFKPFKGGDVPFGVLNDLLASAGHLLTSVKQASPIVIRESFDSLFKFNEIFNVILSFVEMVNQNDAIARFFYIFSCISNVLDSAFNI